MTFSAKDRTKLRQLAHLAYCNPFGPDRIAAEREVLEGDFHDDAGLGWSQTWSHGVVHEERPNVLRITELANGLVERFRATAVGGDLPKSQSTQEELVNAYWDVVTYVLLYRHITGVDYDRWWEPSFTAKAWRAFLADYRRYVDVPGMEKADRQAPGHLFACLYQVHRSFGSIYEHLLGDSLPIVRLRAAVWESIFTGDMRRYRRVLYSRMVTLPTLVTGASGTGKELVARAIGLSQYIPFDESRAAFVGADRHRFHALHLAALSQTLIESELFGHRKGAFTGAIADRVGWLEACQPAGAIFLDEIGELSLELQVKLLRVVQYRTFSRLGETTERTFSGKLIGATNRDLDTEMCEGRFREDLYYRLCADRIVTPGLREQLDDRPQDLEYLVLNIARRLAGDDADEVTREVFHWIRSNLGNDYPWRGNFRELEHCVSSVIIRGSYVPSASDRVGMATRGSASWLNEIAQGTLNADQVLARYCTWIYFRTGSYESAAKQLGLDRRTVKAKIDAELLQRLKRGQVSFL